MQPHTPLRSVILNNQAAPIPVAACRHTLMDLYSSQPYWLMKDGIVSSYRSLPGDTGVDIAIIGAGISGALCAYYLRNSPFSLAVLDRRHVGMGSTAASTAFLQYEIDTPLAELARRMPLKDALASYRLCRKAIYDIEKICRSLHPHLGFHLRPSLHYASYKTHTASLLEEYTLRAKHGFDVQWLQPADIRNTFSFDAPGAILSADGGEVDAYLLTHALLGQVSQAGHHIYSNTGIRHIEPHQRSLTLHTEAGHTITARKLIIAAGYESTRYIPHKIADTHATYALVSEPVDPQHIWHQQVLAWETADPYLYFRVVDGNRILIGGKDDKFHNPAIRDARIRRKKQMLLHAFSQKMKHIPIRADFCWAGAFLVTKDGLPYIGSIPQMPHTYFALGYGGNGITFSAIAAGIIRNTLLGRKNPNAHLFAFGR